MIDVRKSEDRGQVDWGWLQSRHSFSFGEYYDSNHMGYRDLRVINEDHIEPGRGFGTHPHRDMEIITYVCSGIVLHQDSIGNRGMVRAGEVQRMTAGTGIQHSEHNGSVVEPLHLLQIWIHPAKKNLTPGYQQITLSEPTGSGTLRLILSPDGRDGSLVLHQDVQVYSAFQEPGEVIQYPLASNRFGWIQLVRGQLSVNDAALASGDGAAISPDSLINVTARQPSEWIFFDLC